MRVLLVTSEAFPLAKTGGLADFSWGLAKALTALGCDIRLLMPAYPQALEQVRADAEIEDLISIPGGGMVALWSARMPGSDLPVWLVDSPALFDRAGGLYQDDQRRDWPDNGIRFGVLSHVGAAIGLGEWSGEWRPDILHLNDWQAGMVAAILEQHDGPRPAVLFTIHNMAFQGLFQPDVLPSLGLPWELNTPSAIEYYGDVSYLKAGLQYADRVVTVSPTYAREILSSEFGFGLDGLLRQRVFELIGIRNGIDPDVWNPADDAFIAQPYMYGCLAGKRQCKSTLRALFGLYPDDDRPVFSFVSRLTHQKMADCLVDIIPGIVEQGGQIVVHGQGDKAIEGQLKQLAKEHPGSVGVLVGYAESYAHRIIAGADALLAPARFEPCGLTQMYAMRYGTLPIVTRVGGLAETVVDATPTALGLGTATGFIAPEVSTRGVMAAVDRALTLHGDRVLWHAAQMGAMREDFSWRRSAARYLDLYQDMMRHHKHGGLRFRT